MSRPASITNQPFPTNFTHRKSRRSHLPNYPRNSPYMQEPHHGRDH